MKKIILAVALVFSIVVSAQKKITEGKVIAKQTISTDNEQAQAQFDAIGEIESVTYFKNKNSKAKINNPGTGDVVTIINSEKNEMLILMDNDVLGKLYMLKKELVTKEDLKNIKVAKGDKTKKILGYECQQYIATVDKNGVVMEMELFTTEEIPVVSQQATELGNKIKGFPLYVITKLNQMGISMEIISEVTSIKEEKVSDDLFDTAPPEGYKNMEDQ